MRIAIITGSVSRQAGGTFDAIRRPASMMVNQFGASIQIFGTRDADTEADHSDWHPLSPLTFAVSGPRSFGYSRAMDVALRQFQPDMQHIHGIWMYYSLVNYRYHGKVHKPYIISPHGMLDSWALANSAWKKRFVSWAFEKQHLAQASCLHALCPAELTAMRRFGMRNPICIVPNGIDLPERQGYVAPWADVVAGKRVLLYLGRLHAKKGLLNLLRAWRQAIVESRSNSGWILAVAGWGQDGHEVELQKLSQDLGLENSILFLGPQFGPSRQACYENADAFILPSFSEGLPMTVLEAWAYGLPVLMTPHCNLQEGFDCGAALQIEPDVDKIAKGLEQLFSLSDIQRKEMGLQGVKLVQQRFSWRKIAGQFYDVYRWVVGGGVPPDCVRFG